MDTTIVALIALIGGLVVGYLAGIVSVVAFAMTRREGYQPKHARPTYQKKDA